VSYASFHAVSVKASHDAAAALNAALATAAKPRPTWTVFDSAGSATPTPSRRRRTVHRAPSSPRSPATSTPERTGLAAQDVCDKICPNRRHWDVAVWARARLPRP
jgi:hypothetical protein